MLHTIGLTATHAHQPILVIWFGRFPTDLVRSVAKGKFRPPLLRNGLTDFDEIRISELSPEDQPSRKMSSCHFDPTTWVVSTNTQHDWKKTISGVHVFPDSAETLVTIGGITNHHSIAYSLSNISVKNQSWLLCVEVIVCNISVAFATQCSSVQFSFVAAMWSGL